MRSLYTLGYEYAMKAVAVGLEEAKNLGVQVAISVVDVSGSPVALVRMDGASPATFQVALEKARASVWTGAETAVLDQLASQRPAFITTGMCMVEGGVPVLYHNHIVGAIGTSGAEAEQDARISQIACQAICSDPLQ